MRNWILQCVFGLGMLIFLRSVASAAIFDASDFLEEGDFSLGLQSEILINDPTGEGIELRLKYGLSTVVNLQAILGTGNGRRGFRTGLQTMLSIFPDSEGQFGVGLLMKSLYIRRDTYGAFQQNMGLIVHKIIEPAEFSVNLYFSAPLIIELHDGVYETGSQAVLGGITNFNEKFYFVGEIGVALANFESYLSAGGGLRF